MSNLTFSIRRGDDALAHFPALRMRTAGADDEATMQVHLAPGEHAKQVLGMLEGEKAIAPGYDVVVLTPASPGQHIRITRIRHARLESRWVAPEDKSRVLLFHGAKLEEL